MNFLLKRLKEMEFQDSKIILIEGTPLNPSDNLLPYILKTYKSDFNILDFGENPSRFFYLLKRIGLKINLKNYLDGFSFLSEHIEEDYPITEHTPYSHKIMEDQIYLEKVDSKNNLNILNEKIDEFDDLSTLVIKNIHFLTNFFENDKSSIYEFFERIFGKNFNKIILCLDFYSEEEKSKSYTEKYLLSYSDLIISNIDLESGYSKDISGNLFFKSLKNMSLDQKNLKFKTCEKEILFFEQFLIK